MTKENWTDIHKDFGLKIRINETYQQLWEKEGLTCQDAQEWIKIGFTPRDCRGIKSWKNHNFTPQQTKSWIEVGLEPKESNFASYLKQNNYQPSTINLEEARNEYYDAQNWLNINYPNKQETKEVRVDYPENIQGPLTISDYSHLETIDIQKQKNLTQLQINNCPNLKELIIRSSHLTSLDLTGVLNLEKLNLQSIPLTNLDLTQNKKLEKLSISFSKLTN